MRQLFGIGRRRGLDGDGPVIDAEVGDLGRSAGMVEIVRRHRRHIALTSLQRTAPSR
jgi:hypothetical protein